MNETKKGNPEMSTNAWIIAKNPAAPAEARQVYVHWDGGFWHVGPMLLAYYNTDERVQALINGGNMSTLAPVVGECEFYNRPGEEAQDTDIPAPFGPGDQLGMKTTEVVCFDREVFEYYWDGENWYVDDGLLLSAAIAIYNAQESAKNG
jgi:hypothetical protein